jgi:hypothetical protein
LVEKQWLKSMSLIIDGTNYPTFNVDLDNVQSFLLKFEDRARAAGKTYQEMVHLLPSLLGDQARSVWNDVDAPEARCNRNQWTDLCDDFSTRLNAVDPKASSFYQRVMQMTMYENETIAAFLARFRRTSKNLLLSHADTYQAQFVALHLYNVCQAMLQPELRLMMKMQADNVTDQQSLHRLFKVVADIGRGHRAQKIGNQKIGNHESTEKRELESRIEELEAQIASAASRSQHAQIPDQVLYASAPSAPPANVRDMLPMSVQPDYRHPQRRVENQAIQADNPYGQHGHVQNRFNGNQIEQQASHHYNNSANQHRGSGYHHNGRKHPYKKDKVCSFCGKIGHLEHYCRNKQKYCNYCKAHGHTTSCCFDKIRDDAYKKGQKEAREQMQPAPVQEPNGQQAQMAAQQTAFLSALHTMHHLNPYLNQQHQQYPQQQAYYPEHVHLQRLPDQQYAGHGNGQRLPALRGPQPSMDAPAAAIRPQPAQR